LAILYWSSSIKGDLTLKGAADELGD